MVQQNLQGVEQWHTAAHDQNNSASMMNEAFYNQTAFSGNRFFDDLSVPANVLKTNLFSWWWDRRMDREYLLRDVLQANLGWLALATAGLALGGRDLLAQGGKVAAHVVKTGKCLMLYFTCFIRVAGGKSFHGRCRQNLQSIKVG
jgi:hypothetical protein